ncbi:MAG: glycerol kinase GlpK [Myxococcota bacterium]
MQSHVLALDQGTTSSRAIVFDQEGRIVSSAAYEFPQNFPRPGWVEHNPEEIWDSQLRAARAALSQAGIAASEVRAIGITNQRETAVVWEKGTGKPLANAIVWQCRRTADMCELLRRDGHEENIRQRTGLKIDPYFSGTKVRWFLEEVPGLRARAEAGEVLFGTVDSWLIYRLTGGRVHATDYTNASRTLLYNIRELAWDAEILGILNLPPAMLPEVVPSSGVVGETDPALLGAGIPIAGIAGDQQAALFGQGCFEAGMAKNTYGTGCFILANTGEKALQSGSGLVTTIAWGIGGRVEYALEGSIFVGGAVVQWLRDGLRIIEDAAETEGLANEARDNGGVYFVPAFVGLGAPYWDPYARGTLVGLTRGTSRAHIARAALEAIAYQTRDVFESMERDASLSIPELRVDGGATANNFLMQFQADILGRPVVRAAVAETTALGAAFLAGLATDLWKGYDDVSGRLRAAERFEPTMGVDQRDSLYAAWGRAVDRARDWEKP